MTVAAARGDRLWTFGGFINTRHPVRAMSKTCFQHAARSGAVQTRDLRLGVVPAADPG
jgi:hypothetical protein